MTRSKHLMAAAVIALAALASVACLDEGGIGMGVPNSGARWSGPGNGPDVLVGGGPVYE
jgi:hypothetical protein